MSKRHLRRIIRKYYGMTLSNVMLHKRLEYSKQPLILGNMKIAEIAAAAGFSSVKYYSASFHRHFGTTPTQYRKLYTNVSGTNQGQITNKS